MGNTPKSYIFLDPKRIVADALNTEASSSANPEIVSMVSTLATTSVQAPQDYKIVTCINEGFCENKKSTDLLELSNTGDDFVLDIDPAKWDLKNTYTIDSLIKSTPKQNVEKIDLTKSARFYNHINQHRYASRSIFFSKSFNGELHKRDWLLFSESTGTVVCLYCKLFGKDSSFKSGFNDWKNVYRIDEHEKSAEHRNNAATFISRSTILGKIDTELHSQYVSEKLYWENVLKRVVSVVKFVCTRELAFRGTEEKFGSLKNGNFLGLLELISEYDNFLDLHIKRFGNPGSGNVCYLSKTICNEFINLMGDMVRNEIISELKKSKYYSISVDSTPDITHTDQLTFIVRYVTDTNVSVERFLTFVENCGHKSADMEKCVLDILVENQINIEDCRGQSYDNASNMAGVYSGLQARIKQINRFATFVPCAAHSLNLVGAAAAECCLGATEYFMFVQKVYTFFSASTGRWSTLRDVLEQKNNLRDQSTDIEDKTNKSLFPKALSTTRWSARADACKALATSYSEFCEALLTISKNTSEKPVIRAEATGLLKEFNSLEKGILTAFWSVILQKCDKASKSLQTVDTDLSTAVKIYKSLIGYFSSMRDQYDSYEERGKKYTKEVIYKKDQERKKQRKRQFDEGDGCEVKLDGKNDFRINVFIKILDSLNQELEHRVQVYSEIEKVFGFLSNIQTMDDADIRINSNLLQNLYPQDLDESFMEEMVQFKYFIKDFDQVSNVKDSLKFIREKNLVTMFPNIEIAARIFLTLPITNASGERSFSTLNRTKTHLRNSVGQEILSNLAILSINSDITTRVDFHKIISEFANKKSRKRI